VSKEGTWAIYKEKTRGRSGEAQLVVRSSGVEDPEAIVGGKIKD